MEETTLFPGAAWKARLDELTERHNEALEAEDHEAAKAVRDELFAAIRAQEPQRGQQGVELHIKTSRNELIRSYIVRGWYAEALDLTEASLEPLAIDRTCPNRPSVVQQAHGRALIEAGRLEEAQAVLERARAQSAAFLALVEEGWRSFPDDHAPIHEAGAPTEPHMPGGTPQGPPLGPPLPR
jgi:tetratricopeptide (TPR) repeat protein